MTEKIDQVLSLSKVTLILHPEDGSDEVVVELRDVPALPLWFPGDVKGEPSELHVEFGKVLADHLYRLLQHFNEFFTDVMHRQIRTFYLLDRDQDDEVN